MKHIRLTSLRPFIRINLAELNIRLHNSQPTPFDFSNFSDKENKQAQLYFILTRRLTLIKKDISYLGNENFGLRAEQILFFFTVERCGQISVLWIQYSYVDFAVFLIFNQMLVFAYIGDTANYTGISIVKDHIVNVSKVLFNIINTFPLNNFKWQ